MQFKQGGEHGEEKKVGRSNIGANFCGLNELVASLSQACSRRGTERGE